MKWALMSLTCLALVAGCKGGEKPAEQAKTETDPAVTSALGDEIMVDPELAGQQAITGSAKIELPPQQRTPEAVAAIRAEAAKLVGGTIQSAPAAGPAGGIAKLVENAATAAQIAEAARAGKVDCSAKVQYSARWATALPPALAVYPQGAVQEAAGTDEGGCKLRVVSFVTPVTPGEVVDFYFTRLSAAGYAARHQADGKDHVLGGEKGAAAYLVYARALENGVTEVDVVSGG